MVSGEWEDEECDATEDEQEIEVGKKIKSLN